jgi:hypothetical protein
VAQLLASFLFLYSIQSGSETCFPGGKESVSSARHVISYTWKADLHQLYFQKSRRDKGVRLLTFDRSACVRWSPVGDFFALTNYAGSNLSIVEIVSSDDLSNRVRIADLLPSSVKTLTAGARHTYIEASSWDASGLTVRVHGDRETEPRNFDLLVSCGFESAQWRCRALP